ncbi:MAG: PAS domain S-box protein [Elusimicrobia bacterium]|nr:PAS domain S-box protein [Elusimicrobiota bacterium]
MEMAQRIARVGSWRLDLATNHVVWSTQLYRMFGLNPELPPPDYPEHRRLFTPESWERLSSAVPCTQETGVPYELELETVATDGTHGWMLARGEALRDESNAIVALQGIALDITARKKAEEALRESESRSRAVVEASPVPLAINDNQGNITFLNKAFTHATGYTAKDIPTLADWWPLAYPDPQYRQWVVDNWRKNLGEAARTGRPFVPMEVNIRCNDGSARTFMSSAASLDENSSKAHLVILNDITERKRTEEALRESHLLIEGIINAISVRIFWKNRELVYLGCNASFARDAGFHDSKDIVGKDDFQMGWREQAESYRGDDRQVIESGLPKLLIEEPQTTPEGNAIVLLTSKIPLRDSKGEIIGVLGTYMDITEHKQAEAALGNMQKLESLGALAGGIAHDFNNILTAILGNLSLLQSGMKAGGEAAELVKEAQEACGTANNLSNQLLTFSKGGSPIVKVLDLRFLLTRVAGFAARGSNARCVFDLGDSPLAVNVDKDQISQVIQNLVINAAQAMPLGGDITMRAAVVTLEMNEQPHRAAGRYVRLTVSDQGSGIQPAHLSKIFDPYFSTKGVGRGLGLAMCYSIMAKHGGNIGAELKPGAGAVFTLHFPAADAADIPAEQARPALTTGSGKVLIMDDEAPLAKVLKRMLERLGYQAETVADGQAALDAYRRALEAGKPYDAVIMDLTVAGGMGGKETIGKLKALDPKAKAIVSSGYSNDPVMAEYAAQGFSGALGKPYSIEQVSEALRLALDPPRNRAG